jgi:hypothetical protein
MPIAPSNYETLSAMITPALFMTSNGSLIISTSNRMARIVDRIRVLNDLGDRLDRGEADLDFPEQRREHIIDQINQLEWRSLRIRYALTMLYMALGSFVGTSLTLALDVMLGNRLLPLPTFLAIAGVGLMLGACVNLIREAHMALRSSHREVGFYRDLRSRRAATRDNP